MRVCKHKLPIVYNIRKWRKIKSSPFRCTTVKNKTLYAKMINDDSA